MAAGVVGSILAVLFMVLLLVPIPVFNSSLGTESYLCLTVWTVLGCIFYVHSRKNRGSNVSRVSKGEGSVPA